MYRKQQVVYKTSLGVLILISLFTVPLQAASFEGLGHLGVMFESGAYAVSYDSTVVVGYDLSMSLENEAFRWTSTGGMEGLGDLAGGSFGSWAYGVSDDGSVVVGYSHSSSGPEAFRWTSGGGMVGLGDLGGGGFDSRAWDISSDGLVVVGHGGTASGTQAFRWTSGGGMVTIGDLPGGSSYSAAYGISSDGSVIVGTGNSASGYEAFRWTSAGGMAGLGDLEGGSFSSNAWDVSGDGLVVVGKSDSSSGTEAFRWTSEGGMVGLGDLPGGTFSSRAEGVSYDGSVVVGYGRTASGWEAFIWDETNGMRNLKDVLENEYGLDLTGWTLTYAWDISEDGSTIVGQGAGPSLIEAWKATLFKVIRVDSSVFVDPNVVQDGSSWATAYNYLQDALAAADWGDQIWVAQGTYRPDEGIGYTPGDRTASFQLKSGVEIYGGFPSGGDNWVSRDADINLTVLSGDLLEDDGPAQWQDYAENSYNVVDASGTEPNAILDGFTITSGNANNISFPHGGGIYNSDGEATIIDCIIKDSRANQYGGGVYNLSGNASYIDCVFRGNYAGLDGGGIHNQALPMVTGCTFIDNEAANRGGGMINLWGSAYPKITNCKFIGNIASNGGGLANTSNNNCKLVNCMFINNTATSQGAGIYNNSAGPTVMANCSIYANQAIGSYGGGLYLQASGSMVSDNSIFWANIDYSGGYETSQIYKVSGTLTINTSCVQYWSGTYGGIGNTGGNPQFEDPDGDDNLPGTDDDHLRLGTGSACIDAGSNSAVPADTADLDNDENTAEVTPVDLDMALRFVDDPYTADTGSGSAPIVDMGAYEHKTVCFVDESVIGGAHDGSSWGNAFNYLMDALAIAASGTEIWVAEGTYKPDEFGTDRAASFYLWPGRELYGGFPEGGGNWASRDPENNVTILSGDLNDDDGPDWYNYDENSYHVLDGSDADATAIIDGFTISGGYADGSNPDYLGGGLFCWGANPTINNCIFTLNYADHDGGAIADSGGSITNCTVTDNSAGLDGGGLKHCSGTVTGCIISGNTAGERGGGLYKCSATITGCTISGNSSGEAGGGMFNGEVSPPTITGCTFSYNSTTWGGGGMYNETSSPTITNCTFTNNDAEDGGGIFNTGVSNPVITGCEFTGNYNSGPGGGGGMCNWDYSYPTVTDCTFKNNEAHADGGAVHNIDSTPTFNNCKFVANSVFADFSYGGGAIFSLSDSQPKINSCEFVANKSSSNGGAVSNSGATPTITGCTFTLNTASQAGGAIYGHYSKEIAANSEDEFSSAQGQDSWFYGYYVSPFTSGTFQQLDTFEDPFWYDLDLNPAYPLKWSTGGIPGFDEWVVGRWISDVAGSVNITGNIAISNDPCGMCGDGTMGRIIVDGAQKWNQYVPYDHAEWIPYSITVNVGIGSTVDFAIDPYGATNWCDQTMFVAEIEEVTPSIYPTVSHSILWNNMSTNGSQVALDNSVIRLKYCNVQGGESAIYNSDSVIDWADGNIEEDPNLTPNPHLKAGSPCIDAGDPSFVVDPCAPYDIDGENRIINGRVDIGADEFLDTDADGLPDFWESLHFESATGASASGDPDNDGLTNLEEYELFGSDPNADPIYVDVDNAADPCQNGSNAHPFDTIQEGLDAAEDGDTVLVADGSYKGAGNKELDFAGKSIVLRAISGAASTTIDCEDSGRAFDFDDNETAGAAVVGFTIEYGNTDYGGAIRCDHSHPQFRECKITNNTATIRGGSLYSTYSTPTLADCTIELNDPNVYSEYGGAKIFGDVKLKGNDWVGKNLLFTGDGTIKLYSGAKMDISDSEIRCNVAGMYDIIVPVGKKLVISGDAIIDLATLSPAKSNSNYGTLDCKGKLKVKDKAKIIHANIFITEASVEDSAELANNYISVNSWAPYGQFYIDQTAKVYDNEIHTDGDRIMNLNPSTFAGLIANNELYIIITEGADDTRGGLLECRGADGWANSTCSDPNIFFCQVQPDGIPPFDPNTWTLAELVLVNDAKVNLTNLFDFQKPYDSGGADEVMYVKHLVMGADSILNTGYNRIYYDTSDIAGSATVVNEPLLGFSLINIAFDDEIEFLVRVAHNNYVHPTDPNFNLIYVERIEWLRPDPAGMMRMKNIGGTNARAKGTFAKAEEDLVLVRFEYLFETSDPDVELVIYLSDEPELLSGNDPARVSSYREVDRLPVPLAGQPGSDGSDRFGVYQKYVSPGDLDFIRGTRIEFELIGPDGASVLINNWDPQVHCSSGTYCKDVTGDKGVTVVDFLTVIGEYGESAGLQSDGSSSVCLDGIFSDDGYVDTDDISGWDWTLNSEDRKNLCNTNIPLTDDPPNKSACESCPPDKSAPPPLPLLGPVDLGSFEGAFLVAGKMYDPSQGSSLLRYISDKLYGFDGSAQFVDRFDPVYERTNGRLVKDHAGILYQINLEQGLVRLDNAEVVIPKGQLSITAGEEPRYGAAADVYVGLQGTTGNWWGKPILDAAFDADGFVYVVPVVVDIVSDPNLAYIAAAKLQLSGGSPPYDVVQLYDDPDADSQNDNRELNWLREIEVDSDGYVYVANGHSINESDVLWVYDSDTGIMQTRVGLSDPNAAVYAAAPVGMHVSDTTGSLYLASSRTDPEAGSASLYIMSCQDVIQSAPDQISVQTIEINSMGHISDVTVDPATGTAWILGFKMEDIPYKPEATDEAFYEPYIAQIPYDSSGPVDANCLSDSVPSPENNLALPSSIVWTGTVKCGGVDLDASGIVNFADFAYFVSHWLQSNCVIPTWCEGTDIDPALPDRGDVNVTDLSIFALYWLDTCTYPE